MPTLSGRVRRVAAATVLLLGAAVPVAAQYGNIPHPVPLIEERMRSDDFRIIDWRGSRAVTDRTQRATMTWPDSLIFAVKWANAPRNGGEFNNEPRYEAAAYELQKLFLDESEYVVPPTILRSFPLELVREFDPSAVSTFSGTNSVVVALQFWMSLVTADDVWDAARLETDTAYARHMGNLNVFTYLIRHSDNNTGNILISQVADDPRVFSVDNGVAFRSPPSDRGTQWRNLRVRALPATTVERLRTITREQLDEALGVLVEFRVANGRLVQVEPGDNISRGRGVRRSDDRIQFGLSSGEIGDIEGRIRNLLRDVDRGRITVF